MNVPPLSHELSPRASRTEQLVDHGSLSLTMLREETMRNSFFQMSTRYKRESVASNNQLFRFRSCIQLRQKRTVAPQESWNNGVIEQLGMLERRDAHNTSVLLAAVQTFRFEHAKEKIVSGLRSANRKWFCAGTVRIGAKYSQSKISMEIFREEKHCSP